MAEAQRFLNRQNILNEAGATVTGNPINVRDFKNIQLEVATDSSASLTIKVQASLSDYVVGTNFQAPPDFSSVATSTNRWDYVAVFDLIDPTTVIPGGTGITASGTDFVKNLLVNVDGIAWVCVTVTSYSAGAVTVDSISFNNQ